MLGITRKVGLIGKAHVQNQSNDYGVGVFLDEAKKRLGKTLKSDNVINTYFALMMPYYKVIGKTHVVYDTYNELMKLISKIKQRLDLSTTIPVQMLHARELMVLSGFNIRKLRNDLLVNCFREKSFDCNTYSYIMLTLADEMSSLDNRWKALELIVIPSHALNKYRELNIDYGKVRPNDYYTQPPFNLHREHVEALLSKPYHRDDMPGVFLYAIADVYLQERNYDKAMDLYEESYELLPNAVTVLNSIGVIHYRRGMYLSAKKCFKQALKNDLSHKKAWRNLARAYEQIGNINSAIRCYRAALMLDRKNYSVRAKLGTLYYKKGQYLKAQIYYRRALIIFPEYSYAKDQLLVIEEELSQRGGL